MKKLISIFAITLLTSCGVEFTQTEEPVLIDSITIDCLDCPVDTLVAPDCDNCPDLGGIDLGDTIELLKF